MNATFEQLDFIENIEKNFNIIYLGNYGFYSNGNIAILCKDKFGEFSINIDKNGKTIKA
jgi:hypothetical protein